MKRILLYIVAILLTTISASAARALYVKYPDGFHKYSFNVAGDLYFSPDGKTLYIKGYDIAIDLTQVEYITFDMPVDGQMSSTAHKDRLLQIGEELNSKIHANDAADLIGFAAEYGNLNLNARTLFEKFEKNHPTIYDDDDDDYYSKKINKLIKAMRGVATGDFAASRKVGSVITELFKSDDVTGIFTADMQNRRWVKVAEADYFEMTFKGPQMGKNYTFRVEPSKEYTEWSEVISIKEYDGSVTTLNVSGQVPRTIICTVLMQTTPIFNSIVGIEMNQSDKKVHINTTTSTAKAIVDEHLSISDTAADADMSVTLRGEKVLTNTVKLTGSQLLDSGAWMDNLQGVLDEYEYNYYHQYYYDIDGRSLARRFGSASTFTDVLGQLQVRGHIANYDNSYDDIEKYTEEIDNADSYYEINESKNLVTRYDGSGYWMGKMVDLFNNYTDASFYYDNSPNLQGFLDYQLSTEEYEYVGSFWDDDDNYLGIYNIRDISYEMIPYLTFADGSSFAFDSTYFTGSNFKKLVTDIDDIVDTINNILSDYDY